jgi:hypothetical protein
MKIVRSPTFSASGLFACRNPELAKLRAHKRESLVLIRIVISAELSPRWHPAQRKISISHRSSAPATASVQRTFCGGFAPFEINGAPDRMKLRTPMSSRLPYEI